MSATKNALTASITLYTPKGTKDYFFFSFEDALTMSRRLFNLWDNGSQIQWIFNDLRSFSEIGEINYTTPAGLFEPERK